MEVGEESDAQSLVLRRESGNRKHDLDELQSEPFVLVPVEQHACAGAQGCGREGLQDRSSGGLHASRYRSAAARNVGTKVECPMHLTPTSSMPLVVAPHMCQESRWS